MTKASDNKFPKLIITEGSAPSNADSGDQKLFIDSSDHKLKRKNSSGTVTTIESAATGVASDTIWDAAGDLVVGTGADTAAKLSVGADSTVLTVSPSTHVPVWAAAASGSVATDTIWDAAGDLAVGSGANTAAKLSVGADGDVLTVSASTHVPVWAAAAGGGDPTWDTIALDGTYGADFSGTALPANYPSTHGSPTLAYQQISSKYVAIPYGTGGNQDKWVYGPCPAGDFQIYASLISVGPGLNASYVSNIAVVDTSGNGVTSDMYHGNHRMSSLNTWSNGSQITGSAGDSYFIRSIQESGCPYWLGIKKVGGNYTSYLCAFDGKLIWASTLTGTPTAFTAAYVAVGTSYSNNGAGTLYLRRINLIP